MWPFECVGPNGQTYLHNDNWAAFVNEREVEHPHDWNHRRGLLTLCMPRNTFKEIPGVTSETHLNYKEDDFSTIFQPYPAHLRTGVDPDGHEESFNVFVEDGQVCGEPLTLFSTGAWFFPNSVGMMIFGGKPERFARFRGKFWRVWSASGGGIGVEPPPEPMQPKLEPKPLLRSVDDDWI